MNRDMQRRILSRALSVLPVAFLLGLGLYACADTGNGPLDGIGRPTRISLSLAPVYNYHAGSNVGASVNRIRLTARNQATGTIVGTLVQDVDANAPNWNLALDVNLSDGHQINVIVLVELINVTSGVESIEWSGQTAPISVAPGQTREPTTPVQLFQGPPQNLLVTGLVVSPDAASLIEGDSLQVVAIVSGPPTATVLWSSLDATIATVGTTGRVRALLPGTARIVAVAGPHADTANINVLARVAAVRVAPDSARIAALGQDATFTARVLDPRGADITGAVVNWTSSDPSIAEHLSGGRFRARANGRVTVTATSTRDTRIIGTAALIVAQRVTTFTIDPTAATLTAVGARQTFTARALDAGDQPVAGPIAWRTGNPAVATVDATGAATATGTGTTQIRAVFGAGAPDSVSATANLTVTQTVRTIEVTPADFTFVSLGESAPFTAVAKDANGIVVPNVQFVWSSQSPEIATVNGTGVVQSLALGTLQIRATAGGVTGAATVRVTQRIAIVTVFPREPRLTAIGQTLQLTAVTSDARGNAMGARRALWSSGNPVAMTVDTLGRITAVRNGGALISATIDNVVGTANAIVEQTVQQVVISPDTIRLAAAGDNGQFTASIRDPNGQPINGTPTWTSLDTTVAVVNATGRVTARNTGTTRVIARYLTKADTGVVIVAPLVALQPNLRITGVTIVPADEVVENDTVRISFTIENNGTAAAGPFSVRLRALNAGTNAAIADTDSIFAVPGLAAGGNIPVSIKSDVDTLIAWPDSIKGQATVDVNNQVTESNEADNTVNSTVRRVRFRVVTVMSTPDTLPIGTVGDSALITTVLKDRYNRNLVRTITYMSLNPAVATVNANGYAKAVADGTARIVASSENRADTVVVIVTAPVTAVWVGTSGAWADANNWSPARVPRSFDFVDIPSGRPNNPALSAPVTVARVTQAGGTSIDVGPTTLTIQGSLFSGNIIGTGTVRLTGPTSTAAGKVPNLSVESAVALSAMLEATLSATITATGQLDIQNRELKVGGTFTSNGVLKMLDAAGYASLESHANFTGGNTNGTLQAGAIYVSGNLSVSGSPTAFSPSGTHLTVLVAGDTPRTVTFSAPDTLPAGQHFQNLRIENRASTTLLSDIAVKGYVQVMATSGPVVGAARVATILGDLADPSAVTPADPEAPPPTVRWNVSETKLGGAAPLIPGTLVTNLTFVRSSAMQAPLTLFGNLTVVGGELNLNGKEVNVEGNFATVTGGSLKMVTPTDELYVDGNVVFDGGSTAGKLTDGELYVSGDFTAGEFNAAAFAATGNHHTVFGAVEISHTISLANPDTVPNSQHFAKLTFDNGATTNVVTNIAVLGDVRIDPSAGNIIGAGRTATLLGAILDSDYDVIEEIVVNLSSAEFRCRWQFGTTIFGRQPSDWPDYFCGNVVIANDIGMTRDHHIYDGNLTVRRGELDLASRQVYVEEGNFSTELTGSLKMMNEGGVLYVYGNVTFAGASTAGKLTEGEIVVGKHFSATGSTTSFAADPGHTLVMDGQGLIDPMTGLPGQASITLSAPGATQQRFGTLYIGGPTQLLSDIVTTNVTLDFEPFVGPGRTATVFGDIYDPDCYDLCPSSVNPGIVRTSSLSVPPVPAYQIGTTILAGSSTDLPIRIQTNVVVVSAVAIGLYGNVVGNVTVTGAAGDLKIPGSSFLGVSGNFLTELGGRLNMQEDPCDCGAPEFQVDGSVTFNGGSTLGRLTWGTLRTVGNFTVESANANAFSPSGSFLNLMTGLTSRTISFALPATQYFNNLVVQAAGTFTLGSAITVNGYFGENSDPLFRPTFSGSSATPFTIKGTAGFDGFDFAGAPVILENDTLTFMNITFGAYAGDVDQLTIFAPRAFLNMNGIQFQTAPGAITTGSFLHARDRVEDGAQVRLGLPGVLPADPQGKYKVTGIGTDPIPEVNWNSNIITGVVVPIVSAPNIDWSGLKAAKPQVQARAATHKVRIPTSAAKRVRRN